MADGTIPNDVMDFIRSDAGSATREDLVVWQRHYRSTVGAGSVEEDCEALTRELFLRYPEFRTLLDYRIRASKLFEPGYRYLAHHRRGTELHFNVERLGGGCMVQHGTGSWIFARTIGRNFFINQNVTVGQGRRGGAPAIGDNVAIRTGAVVVGPIRIGSNVMIGANAVVNFDVPDGARVYAPRAVVVMPALKATG